MCVNLTCTQSSDSVSQVEGLILGPAPTSQSKQSTEVSTSVRASQLDIPHVQWGAQSQSAWCSHPALVQLPQRCLGAGLVWDLSLVCYRAGRLHWQSTASWQALWHLQMQSVQRKMHESSTKATLFQIKGLCSSESPLQPCSRADAQGWRASMAEAPCSKPSRHMAQSLGSAPRRMWSS